MRSWKWSRNYNRIIPTVLEATAESYVSTANDILKYASANPGLINTILDEAMQLTHLIRHGTPDANPINYSEYIGMG